MWLSVDKLVNVGGWIGLLVSKWDRTGERELFWVCQWMRERMPKCVLCAWRIIWFYEWMCLLVIWVNELIVMRLNEWLSDHKYVLTFVSVRMRNFVFFFINKQKKYDGWFYMWKVLIFGIWLRVEFYIVFGRTYFLHLQARRVKQVTWKVVSLTRQPPFTPRMIPGTHFC
jgi:hypothetical protein